MMALGLSLPLREAESVDVGLFVQPKLHGTLLSV